MMILTMVHVLQRKEVPFSGLSDVRYTFPQLPRLPVLPVPEEQDSHRAIFNKAWAGRRQRILVVFGPVTDPLPRAEFYN
jgi:hypothetical protein